MSARIGLTLLATTFVGGMALGTIGAADASGVGVVAGALVFGSVWAGIVGVVWLP